MKLTTIWFDTLLLVEQERGKQAEMRNIEREKGFARGGQTSPRWVPCPRCGAGRGDLCRDRTSYAESHDERIEANRRRLLDAETYAVRRASPCCNAPVYLVWRTVRDELSWEGVPCFKCGKTYAYASHASDLAPERIECEHIHPSRVEVTCWASTESRPWKG